MVDETISVNETKGRLKEQFIAEVDPLFAQLDGLQEQMNETANLIDATFWKFYKDKGLSPRDLSDCVDTVPSNVYRRLSRHKSRLSNDGGTSENDGNE